MWENKNTTSTNSLKSIIAVMLLFVFYSSYSQTYKTITSPFILDIEGGINVPTNNFKDYANNGYNVGLMLNKGVYKNLAVGVSAKYNNFGLEDSFESPDNAWSSISLGVGPQYTLAMRMFFIQLYGHIGMSWINTPAIAQYAQGVHPSIDLRELGVLNLENSSTTGLHTDIGIKLGTNLSRRVSLFIGSSYNTSLNSPVKYNSRDISAAIYESGEVNMDIVNTTPFEEKSLSLSSLNLNAGLSFTLGKSSAVRPAQDYNSSRSNKPSPITKPVERVDTDTIQAPAQDYNSSRSNKPSPVAAPVERVDTDSISAPAQDYNSSRSNMPSPVAAPVDRVDTDSVPAPAQDYNSSRSNKPSPISVVDVIDDIDNDDDGVVIIGELSGISSATRQFELTDKNKKKIIGIFKSEISDIEINTLKREFENKKAMIYVRINKSHDNEAIVYEFLKIQKHNKRIEFKF